jgi:hypothetical protein
MQYDIRTHRRGEEMWRKSDNHFLYKLSYPIVIKEDEPS